MNLNKTSSLNFDLEHFGKKIENHDFLHFYQKIEQENKPDGSLVLSLEIRKITVCSKF
jgi:hypothetical protein